MKFDCEVEIKNKKYKFESIEDDPLVFEMKISDKIQLYRHINCDEECESIQLTNRYMSVSNGIQKPASYSNQVYSGKEIKSESFMKELLENVLYGFI